MTKIKTSIKLAFLALILTSAATTKLPAPPDPCYFYTQGWTCGQTTIPNAHRFYMTYVSGTYGGMSVTRNGVACGSTTGMELYTPNWTGTYVVTARTTGQCTITFTFVF